MLLKRLEDASESERVWSGICRLILNTEHSENTLRYHIVKFKKNEMAWQMEGTEYSEGSLGSDYKHFKRKKGE